MQRHSGLLLSTHTLVTPGRVLEEGSDKENQEVEEMESRVGDHRFLEPNSSSFN